MSLSLPEFLERLARAEERVPLDELAGAMQELRVTLEDVRRFVVFSDVAYRRNLMASGPAFQALVLCWKNGQRSPIHDHRGSSCGVKVLSGTALETVFERARNGMVYASRSHAHAPGSVCATEDADIHQVSNLMDDGASLVTLHVYSPPLVAMGTYSLFDASVRDFVEPVYEDLLLDGGGI